MNKNILFSTAALILLELSVQASSNPLWVRNTAISPDGKSLAFTYKGDIFKVNTDGGNAIQITNAKAFDSKPVWSPDGQKLAFSSNREGSDDLYIIPANGGTAKRLTFHSGNETPICFINDSLLLFSASPRPSSYLSVPPFLPQTYIVNINNECPRSELYLPVAMLNASMHPTKGLLYQDKKGYEDVLRKHERSSGTSDICIINGKNYAKLTDFIGHDQNPVWLADGSGYYYISEKDGTLNIYRRNLDGSSEVQLTTFVEHPVRHLSASKDGTIAFSWDGEAYVIKPDKAPTKIDIQIVSDDYDSDKVKDIRTSGATNFAVSPSGEEIAFVLRGDIYVTSIKYNTTKRITNTPGQERCLSFSPDGRTLVYDSDRNGLWQIFTTTIEDKNEKYFTYATKLNEELLYKGEHAAQQPTYSPDGKYVAFLEDRTELKVFNLKSKAVNTALDGKFNYSYSDGDVSYEWSPDSKWFLTSYIGVGGWNNTDIALVSRDGKTVVDLTESGYSDNNPYWALGGKGLIYSSGKYGMKSHGSWGNQEDAILMVLDPDAWDDFNMTEEDIHLKELKKEKADTVTSDKGRKGKEKAKKSLKKKAKEADDEIISPDQFDIASRRFRTKRLTDRSSLMGDMYLNNKGDKFYYVAALTEGGNALYEKDLKEDETKVLAKGISGGLIADKKGETLFALTRNGIKKITLADGNVDDVDFSALYDRSPSKEREYIYDHMLSQVRDKFYDENLHEVNWTKYGEHYRKFLPEINNNRDFAELLSEILGELNASHTGGRTSSGYAKMPTAELGIITDANYLGNGLKIAEILPRGPLSKKSFKINPGDIITKIDEDEIVAGRDYYPLLEGKVGREVVLTMVGNDGNERDIVVKPISAGALSDILYHRWVEHNEHVVDSLSGGKIGYVHVEGMDTESFQNTYDRLLGRYRNCDAVIVDTRYNGGGWLHNDIALLLGGKEYVRYTPRGKYIGSDPFSQWTKPSVMLVNESNYSDAHGTPYVYKTLKIGDLVGSPVPGTMTAVWWESQIDPTIIFGIPQVTSLSVETGKPLENEQLNPDILIYNRPDELINGKDAQLEGAVNHLLKKINNATK